ncbi:MAG TPA: peptide deformylase [Patescibacteria group bacterium]|nr:peptide deformylase [bacterium]HRT11468.1 peptide deformylase [Patescibacteria group bacterium]HRU90201.1 peptide deformylase [Patescibacteria group bacterium]
MDQKQIDKGHVRRLVIYPDSRLRRTAQVVDLARLQDKKFQELIVDMAKTMLIKDGIGLAAPQVGRNWRLIVVNTDEGVWPMINPIITKLSSSTTIEEEGCLSLPNTFGQVRRAKSLQCHYINELGKECNLTAKGTLARVIQHEIDHLNGILFIDYLK